MTKRKLPTYKVCLICQAEFATVINKKTCSTVCQKKYRARLQSERDKRKRKLNHEHFLAIERTSRLKRSKPCPICGTPIQPTSKFCQQHKGYGYGGDKHYAWKGGRCKSSQGYILVYRPGHHRGSHWHGKYVLEHILVWEEANGKPLPEGWMVHHLNGIKDDNRPRNLVALPSKKHYLVLQAKAKRIQELEALLNGQGHLL